MPITGEAKRVRIYLGENDKWQGKSLAHAIIELCRQEGIAGATVVRGVEGYGSGSRIHTAHIVDLSSELPLIVEFVDSTSQVEKILPQIQPMLKGGLITAETVTIIHPR